MPEGTANISKQLSPLNSESFRLSVVIPVFNEVFTLATVIDRIRAVSLRCEILVVDDGSTDGTKELLAQYADAPDVVIIFHEKNLGKGAALRSGFLKASGDIVLVQDADLEYDPAEYAQLVEPILQNSADVVFGSRFHPGAALHQDRSWHTHANRLVTKASNFFTGLRITDMETCYKVFRREVIATIAPTLQESRFGIEPELTAKIARLPNVRVLEVPIRYSPRSYAEGKKIRLRDGLWALWCCMKY